MNKTHILEGQNALHTQLEQKVRVGREHGAMMEPLENRGPGTQ